MKILIIEDDDFFRNFYSSKLKELGYEVDNAPDGEQGMIKIKQFQPDLILLDLIMPKKDGFQLLTELKDNNPSITIPVIVFSTLGQELDVVRAKGMGAQDYINKSVFDFNTVIKKIETYKK